MSLQLVKTKPSKKPAFVAPRNYLAEAFKIVASAESTLPIEREHLIAVVKQCRDIVSGWLSLPEGPKEK